MDGSIIGVRPASANDVEFLFAMASDPLVVRWVGDGKPWSRDYLDERLSNAISAIDETRPDIPRWYIGFAGRHDVGLLSLIRRADFVELGYWIHPDQWGRGHAGRLIDHARRLAGPMPLTAQVHQRNSASRRVLERAGFELVDAGELLVYRQRSAVLLDPR